MNCMHIVIHNVYSIKRDHQIRTYFDLHNIELHLKQDLFT